MSIEGRKVVFGVRKVAIDSKVKFYIYIMPMFAKRLQCVKILLAEVLR